MLCVVIRRAADHRHRAGVSILKQALAWVGVRWGGITVINLFIAAYTVVDAWRAGAVDRPRHYSD